MGRVGAPDLPVRRELFALPPGAGPLVVAVSADFQELGTFRLAPVPTGTVRSEDGLSTLQPTYRSDPVVYGRSGAWPEEAAAVTLTGKVRDQRVGLLEVRPVQYWPRTGRVRYARRLTVRVEFRVAPGAPSLGIGSRRPESEAFEGLLRRGLLNGSLAPRWRVGPSRPFAAPQRPEDPPLAALKLYIREEGLYRVDGATVRQMLEEAGVALAEIPARFLRVTFRGQEVPVYVRGEADGRLDPQDYVEFFAERPNSFYSPYHVYWLIVGQRPGLRVAEAEGAPRDPLATVVPSFRSRLHFEENKLFLLLQHVPPEALGLEDPHQWYEARDHWFFFGIKNNSDKNDAEYSFPLFDPARTFDRAQVIVRLQGGTPVDHDVLVSLNGVKLGRAQWSLQDEFTVQRAVAPENLQDPVVGQNTLRLSRVDTNEDDDVDNYPYHVYVNWFELEYTRLFRAVGDALRFRTPPFKEPPEVRRRRTLEYVVDGFAAPDVVVYEHDGRRLLRRFRNVEVESYRPGPEDRKRWIAIQRALGGATPVPERLYRVRFQVPDLSDTEYVAASSLGAKRPERIVVDRPSHLREPSNGADWIVIYPPRFREAAEQLAEWRRSPKGGGYRALAVDVTDIYDEYGDGMVSPWAIKAFLTDAFQNWQAPPLTHVVILADGTYDFYGADQQLYPEAPEFLGYIPTHYVWTLFGQTASDHWFTTVSGIDPLPDFFIGRIPVETEQQARDVVRKIMRYEGNPPNGAWRRRIISVADDDTTNSGDFIFRQSLNEISQNHTLLGYQTVKIFLEDIIREVNANPEKYLGRRPAEVARDMISDHLSEGAIIAQYAGHGGRLVWAHEIIFDNRAIRQLQPSGDRYPLMFVLSCNNGYFDAPADPSMAEVFLRMPDTGVIAMVSATRLTFGSGNDALNRIIFDDIFKRNVRGLGEITFYSKTRLMLERGLSHFEVMQQYSLFGDPATRLYMAENEVRPEVLNRSVRPGETLRIAPGQVYRTEYVREEDQKRYIPLPDFSGSLVVTARFTERGTGNVIEQFAESVVQNGRYPEIQIQVPSNAQPGRAQVEFFAQSRDSLALGGATFAVAEPLIDQRVVQVGPNRTVELFARIVDDQGIQSAAVRWFDRNGGGWRETPLLPDPQRGPGWYRLGENVPLPPPGESWDYQIQVTDREGNRIESPEESFLPEPLPDWRVYISEQTGDPWIRYSTQGDSGLLIARLENTEPVETTVPVEVAFYLGHPDQDGDRRPDPTARELGTVRVLPSEWRRQDLIYERPEEPKRLRDPETPFTSRWIAEARLPVALEPGRYPVFVWLEPNRNAETDPPRERRTFNNLDGTTIQVAEVPYAGRSVSLNVPAGTGRIDLPGGAVREGVSLRMLPTVQPPVGQPTLSAVPGWSYQIEAGEETELIEAAVLELALDLTRYRRIAQEELGLPPVPYQQLPPEQRRLVDQFLQPELEAVGLYRWLPELERWRRIADGELLRDAQGQPVLRTVTTDPETPPFRSRAITIYHTEQLAAGRWALMLVGSSQFDVYYAPNDNSPLERIAQGLSLLGSAEQIPPDRQELPFLGLPGEDLPWEFGDVVRFQVISGDNGPIVVSPRTGNDGNGLIESVQVVRTPGPGADRWAVVFVSPDTFQVYRASRGVVQEDGSPLLGRVGELWEDPESGVRFRIWSGKRAFSAGDAFRFETHTAALVRGSTTKLGTFALFRSSDQEPPVVEVRVSGQDFADGDPVPNRPPFRITLSDASGVAPEDVALELSRDGAEFQPASSENYTASATAGSGALLINYTPELEPGNYVLRVLARDLEGQETTTETRFRVSQNAEILSVLNYPNPFRTYTDLAIEMSGAVEGLEVTIYSVAGRVVQRLEHPATAGFVRIRWDGRDAEGREVANGVYYARVRAVAEGKEKTKTLKLLKLR
ncbi:MAG: hypothetical protein KatS3mg115_0436 [Candidatus Poribacteria bacterium]|nr:MAG: hypothetical protein KatS3mg115_0436 [Candidatus Poribacteria bacterium]